MKAHTYEVSPLWMQQKMLNKDKYHADLRVRTRERPFRVDSPSCQGLTTAPDANRTRCMETWHQDSTMWGVVISKAL